MDKHEKLAEIKQWISNAERGNVDWNLFTGYRDWLNQELESNAELSYKSAVCGELQRLKQLHIPLSVISRQGAQTIETARKKKER